jgi:hypothetical protein
VLGTAPVRVRLTCIGSNIKINEPLARWSLYKRPARARQVQALPAICQGELKCAISCVEVHTWQPIYPSIPNCSTVRFR